MKESDQPALQLHLPLGGVGELIRHPVVRAEVGSLVGDALVERLTSDPRLRAVLIDLAIEVLQRPEAQDAVVGVLTRVARVAGVPSLPVGERISRAEVLRRLKVSDSTLSRRLKDTPELLRLEHRVSGGRPEYEWPEFQRQWNRLCR